MNYLKQEPLHWKTKMNDKQKDSKVLRPARTGKISRRDAVNAVKKIKEKIMNDKPKFKSGEKVRCGTHIGEISLVVMGFDKGKTIYQYNITNKNGEIKGAIPETSLIKIAEKLPEFTLNQKVWITEIEDNDFIYLKKGTIEKIIFDMDGFSYGFEEHVFPVSESWVFSSKEEAIEDIKHSMKDNLECLIHNHKTDMECHIEEQEKIM